MDYQMDINEKFEKLERMKYGNQSIRDNNRLSGFYDNCKWDEDYEDMDSLNEYIIEHED